MRTPLAPLASAALALLAGDASALGVPDPGLACTPESPVCSPGTVLCPRLGGLFGWCVQPAAGADGAGLGMAAGHHYGPRAAAWTGAGWADLDGDGLPDPAARHHLDQQLCPRGISEPELPC